MSFSSFLYRRLSRWITCEFELDGANQSKIALKNKYEVASFKDVFCHPFYWQVFQWVKTPPKLVVDCGAHCGHFSLLADLCFASKFSSSDTRYLLIEPNPYLIPVIRRNLRNSKLDERAFLSQGLLGANSGSGTLWINSKNFLATGTSEQSGTKAHTVDYINLSNLVGDEQDIDLMKIDIEGGEYEFISSQLNLFKRTHLIFMELHEASAQQQSILIKQMESVGLDIAAEPVESHGQKLIIFQRT